MSCAKLCVATAAFLCLGLDAELAAQTSPPAAQPSAAQPSGTARACNVFPGWWESTDLAPVFPGGSIPGPPKPNDCDFQVWSWTAFVSWMQNDETGRPRFLSLPTPDELVVDGAASAAAAAPAQRTLRLAPRAPKPHSMESINQAFGGPLIDQNGRAVYYAIHMDPTYFTTTQEYYGPTNYEKASPTTTYPVGATVFKSAWRIVQPNEIAVKAYTTSATIDLLKSNGIGGIEKSGDTATATVALVGVHVVGVVQDHPEFIWATFEQVENAPDLPPLVPPTSDTPVSPQNFTFYKAETTAAQSNQEATAFTVDQASQAIAPITNVFRQFAFGNATPDRVADIDSTNKLFRQMIGGGSVKKIDQVFSNYNLIGSLWMLPNTLEPNFDNLQPNGVGSVDLANSVLETYAQGAGTSCFSCHTTGKGDNYPGKDVNLSHTLLGGLAGTNSLRRRAR